MNSITVKLMGCVLIGLAALGSAGCLKMLPNSGVKTVAVSQIEDSDETLLLRSGDDRVIRTIVSAIESSREAPVAFAPEYVVRLEHVDGTTTRVGVLGTALEIDGKTYTASIDLGARLQAIASGAPSAGGGRDTHAAQPAVATEPARPARDSSGELATAR